MVDLITLADRESENAFTTIQQTDKIILERVSPAETGIATVSNTDLVNVPFETIDITSATASIAKDIPTAFNSVYITFSGFLPATADEGLVIRLGTGGAGGSFVSTSSYTRQVLRATDTTVIGASSTETSAGVTSSVDSTGATKAAHGTILIQNVNTASATPTFEIRSAGSSTVASILNLQANMLTTAGNYNAIQFLCGSGNIASLQAQLYGVRHA